MRWRMSNDPLSIFIWKALAGYWIEVAATVGIQGWANKGKLQNDLRREKGKLEKYNILLWWGIRNGVEGFHADYYQARH